MHMDRLQRIWELEAQDRSENNPFSEACVLQRKTDDNSNEISVCFVSLTISKGLDCDITNVKNDWLLDINLW